MPVFDSRERPMPVLPFLVLSNIFPLIGIIYYDLSFFAFFYLYWVETVIISIFRWVKMFKAKGTSTPDPNFSVNGETLTFQQVNSKRYMIGLFFFWRSFIMIFYLIFIIVFVGLMGNDDANDPLSFARAFLFMEPWMRITLLSYLITHGVEYIFWLRNRDFERESLVELGSIFDARTIVLHVVIVLGVFLSNWVSDELFPQYPKAGTIAFASLFVLVKTFADIMAYKWQTSRQLVMDRVMPKLNKASE